MSSFKDLISDIFEELTQLRSNPKEYSKKIQSEFENYRSNNARHRPNTVPVLTREGLKAVNEAFDELQSLNDLKPLEWSDGLSSAALTHCNDTGPLGIVGHIGSRETTLQQRIERNGKWSESIAEALDYGSVDYPASPQSPFESKLF